MSWTPEQRMAHERGWALWTLCHTLGACRAAGPEPSRHWREVVRREVVDEALTGHPAEVLRQQLEPTTTVDEARAVLRRHAPWAWLEHALDVEFLQGSAPTQGWGTLHGQAFYYRARGTGVEMSVARVEGADVVWGMGPDVWHREDDVPGDDFAASYLSAQETLAWLDRYCTAYAADLAAPSGSG